MHYCVEFNLAPDLTILLCRSTSSIENKINYKIKTEQLRVNQNEQNKNMSKSITNYK